MFLPAFRLLSLAAVFPAVLSAQSTLVVTTTADSGAGSLRQSVSSASSGDTIQFDLSLDGSSIALSSGEIAIASDLTIDASTLPSGLTVSANNLSRVFHITGSADVRMERLTVRDGMAGAGGGIAVQAGAQLELVDCTITGSTSLSTGGCIHNEGQLVVRGSTISFGNSQGGGGIFCQGGSLSLESSSIVRNTAEGAPAFEANGTSVTLTNSTVAENVTTGFGPQTSIILTSCALEVTHCTLTQSSNITVLDSAVTTSASFTNSLLSAVDPITDFITPPSAIAVRDSTIVVPLAALGLAPLKLYRGMTETQPPLLTSPALDGGSPGALPTDQHGLPRTVGPAPDIGAVELQNSTPVTSPLDDAAGSLRRALVLVRSGGQILFDPTLDGATITLASFSDSMVLDRDVALDASSLPNGLTLSGGGTTPIFEIEPSVTAALDSLTLTLGATDRNGGAIFNDGGTLSLNRCTITQCLALIHGGAIFNSRGTVTIVNSTIASNFAGRTGGGISGNQGTIGVRHSTITDNEAISNDGGGIKVFNEGLVTLENSIVAGNEAFLAPDNLADGVLTELGNNLLSGNPRLAPLANYGGSTPTRPPLPGSPALEGAVLLASTPPTDQMGNSRPSGPLPDLGAVEAVAVLPALSPLTDSEPDGIPDLLEGPGRAYPHLDPNVDDSNLDTDGDRSLDADEIANMTDPLDGNDRFRILRIVPAPGFNAQLNPLVAVTVATFPGLSYEFETDQLLQNFQLIPGSTFVADDFEETVQLLLAPNGAFVRGRRN